MLLLEKLIESQSMQCDVVIAITSNPWHGIPGEWRVIPILLLPIQYSGPLFRGSLKLSMVLNDGRTQSGLSTNLNQAYQREKTRTQEKSLNSRVSVKN